MLTSASHEPLSHEELDRQSRYLREQQLKLEWERLTFERESFAQYVTDNVGACNLLSLSSKQQPRSENESTNSDKKYDENMIGKRVCRWWEGNKQYFLGTVDKVTNDSLHIVYDDGDEAWESSVEDPDDVEYKCCRKTSICWKLARHTGRCVGTYKKVEKNLMLSRIGKKDARKRQPPKRLENDNK